jgi:hypothetical protein
MSDLRKAREIVRIECEVEGLTVGMLHDAPRTRTYSEIRGRIAARLRAETNLSLKEIGLILGYASRPGRQIKKYAEKVG